LSITEKLIGFDKMPAPEKGIQYNYILAATKAFFTVAHNVKVFAVDSLKNTKVMLYGPLLLSMSGLSLDVLFTNASFS
jgi:hypothetical protein